MSIRQEVVPGGGSGRFAGGVIEVLWAETGCTLNRGDSSFVTVVTAAWVRVYRISGPARMIWDSSQGLAGQNPTGTVCASVIDVQVVRFLANRRP